MLPLDFVLRNHCGEILCSSYVHSSYQHSYCMDHLGLKNIFSNKLASAIKLNIMCSDLSCSLEILKLLSSCYPANHCHLFNHCKIFVKNYLNISDMIKFVNYQESVSGKKEIVFIYHFVNLSCVHCPFTVTPNYCYSYMCLHV